MIHHHAVPVWGCDDCLREDKLIQAANAEAESIAAYGEWKKTYILPNCPVCGDKMVHDCMYMDDGKLFGSIFCVKLDAEEGIAACGDQDINVEIP